MQTFKVLSILLGYPSAAVYRALDELGDALRSEALLTPAQQTPVLALIDWMRGQSLLELQETYVGLFDRGCKLSLHLFEHTHGDSRERGPAMVHLLRQYEDAGFTLAARELPDYLPLVLEFAAQLPLAEARALLAECMPVLTLMGARLHARGSPYAALFDALEAIAGPAEEAERLRRQAAEEGPDESITRLDEIWMEEAVTFLQAERAPGHSRGTPYAGGAQPVRWNLSEAHGTPVSGSKE
ncbi:nitrate reductase molybdenum cofactor assembly chaperone [Pelomicrobium sp.]|jgi:nitrate reductase delta subunit|uniref:nitrate reductase molybdenum cofactor assembly chaperone n=1 Tax=Pelomicrobium sp. TaxID=2815319 RepID=UPI002FDD42D4